MLRVRIALGLINGPAMRTGKEDENLRHRNEIITGEPDVWQNDIITDATRQPSLAKRLTTSRSQRLTSSSYR